MNTSTRARAVALAICASTVLGALAPLLPVASADAPPARLVVGLPSERAKTYAPGDDLFGATVTRVNAAIGAVAVESRDPDVFFARARADPDVAYAEATPLQSLLLDAGSEYTPADPYLSSQYALGRVRAQVAWSTHRGDPAVSVCIVDTGVRHTHEDLAGSRYHGGYDFVNSDADPLDDNGHGTHVAGIAAATANNSLGIAGGANVGYYAVKVLDAQGFGSWEDVASGITWCADETPPRTVISLSLGGVEGAQVLADAVAYARAQGKLVVAAAGNDGQNDCADDCVRYPARYDEVLAVGCTDASDTVCSFSSRGPEVDLAAPGYSIYSTMSASNRSYGYMSGTSMSAPLVSAGAALAWSAFPGFTAEQVAQRLNATAREASAEGVDVATGRGVVDFACLLAGTAPCPAMGSPPAAPTGIEGVPGAEAGEVALSWVAPPSTASAPVLGYRVYAGADESEAPAPRPVVEIGNVTSFVVRDLSPVFGYSFSVAAFNLHGEGPRTSWRSVVPAGDPCDVSIDDYGYSCVTGPAEFEDVSQTGTYLRLGDDHLSHAIPLGFDFDFYGVSHDEAFVSSNGFITFTNDSEDGCCSGEFLPEAYEPNDLIAAFWEDLDPRGGAPINHTTLGEPGERRFIVQWTDIPHYHYASNAYRATMQIVLHEGSNAIEVRILDAPSDGGTHTTGIEGPGGESALLYRYGEASLGARTILFTPPDQQGPPRALAARESAPGVDLTWLPPLRPQALSGYRIYKGLDVGAKAPLADLGTNTSFHDTHAAPGHTYRYQVVALNPAGHEGVRSRESVVTLGLPPPPSPYVQVEPAQANGLDGWWNTTILATFGATDNGGGVTLVERSLDGGETFEPSAEATLADGSYALVARATDANGQAATSDPVFVSIDATAPTAAASGSADVVHDTQAFVVFEFSEEMDVASTEAAIEGVEVTPVLREAGAASGAWFADWDDAFHLNVSGTGLDQGDYVVRLTTAARDAHGVHLAQSVERAFTVAEPGPLPVITLDPEAPDGLHGWYTVPVTATFSAQDEGTGLDPESIEYSLDNETWTPGTTLALPEGKTTLWARASDPEGHVRQTPTPLVVKVDTTGPTVGVTYDIGNPRRHATIVFTFGEPVDRASVEAALHGADGWTKTWGGEPAILAAEDGATELTLTNDSIEPGDVSVYLGEGARDAHGREIPGESIPEPVTFTVSPTPQPPTPTISLPEPTGFDGAFVAPITATFGATDNGDGVDASSVSYSEDGATFTPGTTLALGEGLHHLYARAASLYGDEATTGPVDVLVDLTAPTVTLKGTGNTTNASAAVALVFSEPMDRASVESSLENASGWTRAWSDDSTELTLSRSDLPVGTHVLAVGPPGADARGVPLVARESGEVTRVQASSPPPPAPEPAPVAPPPPPLPPVGLAASTDGARVTLAWAPPESGPTVTGYRVYRSGDAGGFVLLASTSTPGYADAAVVRGRSYQYRVASTSPAGESAPAETSVSIPAAAPESGIVVTPPEPDGADGWYLAPPAIALSATPEGASVRFGWDGNATLDYAGPLAPPAGQSALTWRAVLAGAPDGAVNSRAFKVDLDAPTVAASLSGATVTATATDGTSGIASVEARVTAPDGTTSIVTLGGSGPYAGTLAPAAVGEHAVVVVARDHAGRESASAPMSFVVAAPEEPLEPSSENETSEPEPADEPIEPASTEAPAPGTGGSAPPPPPPPRIVVEGADPDVGAHGNVTVRLENPPPGAASRFIVVVGSDGNETILAEGQDTATWDTSGYPDGYYDVETRERRGDGSTHTIASARVLVRHPKVSAGAAVGALATGLGAVAASTALSALGSAAFSAGGSAATGAATSAATTASSTVATQTVSAGASRSFDLLGYLRELFTDAGSDALRDRTKNVADIERRRRIRGIVVVTVSALLLAVFFTYADVDTWRWSEFAAALPIFGGAAVMIGLSKFATESVISMATGLRPRFKMWVAGIVSLAGSAMLFNSPFGYPGYVDREGPSNPTPAQRRIVGLQGVAIVGVTIAWALPFLFIMRFMSFEFGDVGVAMVMTAVATSAMPLGPLPGKEVWQWRKSASLGLAAVGFGLYLGYTLVLIPEWVIGGLGVVGLATYAIIFRHLRKAPLAASRTVPVSVSVPVQDAQAEAPKKRVKK